VLLPLPPFMVATVMIVFVICRTLLRLPSGRRGQCWDATNQSRIPYYRLIAKLPISVQKRAVPVRSLISRHVVGALIRLSLAVGHLDRLL